MGLRGEPVGENAAAGKFDPLHFFDSGACHQSVEGLLRRTRVEIQDADGASARMLGRATDRHLSDIDLMFAKDRANPTDDPGNIEMREQQHMAVEVSLQSVIIDRDQSGHVVAEHGDPRFDALAASIHLGGDRRAERAGLAAPMLDQFDPALTEQHGCIDDVDLVGHGSLQKPGAERSGHQVGVFVGNFASILDLARADAAGVPLGQEEPQSVGGVERSSEGIERLGIERGDVDRVADLPRLEEIHEELDPFDGHLRLGLLGTGSKVRGTHDSRHAEQRALGAGFLFEHIERDARDDPLAKPFGQGGFVVDAAAGAVHESDASFEAAQLLHANQVFGFIGKGGVDREIIDPRQHICDRMGLFDVHLVGLFIGQERIEGDDSHAKGLAACGDLAADASHADDAENLVRQLSPHERFAVPLAAAKTLVSRSDAARQGQQQGERMLCRAEGVAGGGVHHDDPETRGRVLVDVVGSHPGANDRLQSSVPFKRFGRDLDAASHDGPIELGERRFEFLSFEPVPFFEGELGIAREHSDPFGCDRVEDQDAVGHGSVVYRSW